MPVAVPTGDYALSAEVDLSPLFGVIRTEATVSVVDPGPEILAKRLSEISSRDGATRRNAIIDLRYFPESGDQVVPALLGLLTDSDPNLRMLVLSVLTAYPAQAAEHVDTFVEILEGGGDVTLSERANAAYLLGRVSPESEKVEKALAKAVETAEDEMAKRRFESALNTYRGRHPALGE